MVIVFTIILSSKWTNLNGVPRRYFVCNYISFWIVFLITFESFKEIKFHRPLSILLMATVLIGGLGTIYNFKYISPKRLTPTIHIVSEFENLGKIGIISEYWNSYVSSASNPSQIKATPNDMSEVRNQNLVDSVFAQPDIYVIKDMWMNTFPDSLEQFGYVLLKSGDEFRIGGCHVCKYQKMKLSKYFDLDKFKYHCVQIYDDKNEDMVRYVSFNCDSCKQMHFVHGPYIPIGIGKFTAQFYMKASNIISEDTFAILDVTADYGMIQLASKMINRTDLTEGNFNYVDLDFETIKRHLNVEFRIYYLGDADICFSHVQLKEK